MIPQKPSRHQFDGERLALSLHAIPGGERIELGSARAPILMLALNASLVEVTTVESRFLLDRTNWLVLPSTVSATARATAPTARLLTLAIFAPLVDLVEATYRQIGLERERLERWLEQPQLLPRTVWVDEIAQRYLFERQTLEAHDNAATHFLETEIVKEVYYLCRDRENATERATSVQKHSTAVERALCFIEQHLFEPRSVGELARIAMVSESTLVRAFKRELGCTPGTHWRTRRLDEALLFLGAGRWSVTEVATRVGYDNPTAFSHAFQLRFGKPPSSFIPRQPIRPAP